MEEHTRRGHQHQGADPGNQQQQWLGPAITPPGRPYWLLACVLGDTLGTCVWTMHAFTYLGYRLLWSMLFHILPWYNHLSCSATFSIMHGMLLYSPVRFAGIEYSCYLLRVARGSTHLTGGVRLELCLYHC